jgi:riboflavin kinase/FMN adenylyltransferase
MHYTGYLTELSLSRPSVVAVGTFDGVHIGHQSLIEQLTVYAQENDLSPVVLTFHPHPIMILQGYRPGYYLTLPDERAGLLEKLGVETVITHPFDENVRHMRASEFLQTLLSNLSMHALWVGTDFAMGYQREGNIEYLQSQSTTHNFALRVVELLSEKGHRISSTQIRELVSNGDMASVRELSGRAYRISGEIIHGEGRGSKIGIPTANLAIHPDKALPLRGVYAGIAHIGDASAKCVINIGYRPTFEGQSTLTTEAHLLDFEANLYGQVLEFDFISRLRDEMKFSGIDALVNQIKADIATAWKILK